MLEGNVVRVLHQGRAVINIEGLGITADSNLPLKPGDRVKLQITEIQPKVVLSLLSREPGQLDLLSTRIRDALPAREPLSKLIPELLAQLRSRPDTDTGTSGGLVESIESTVIGPDNASKISIPRILESLGLRREALLRARAEGTPPDGEVGRDLRTLLARELRNRNAEVGPGENRNRSDRLRSLAENLELIRWLNSVPRKEDSAQLLPLLFHLPGGEWTDVEVYFLKKQPETDEDGDETAASAPPFRVLILLDMPSMGRIRADAFFQRESLHLSFHVEREETRDLIERKGQELVRALEARGWNIHLGVRTLPAHMLKPVDDVRILIPKGYRLLDVEA